jgi:DNA (cytosine-5)-methyltransferase 1
MKYRLSNDEIQILDAWDDFLLRLLDDRQGLRLPGFPLWSDLWGSKPTYKRERSAPNWKLSFEEKNIQFYKEHKKVIDSWFKSNPSIRNAPPSKRKLEWQAQDMQSIWDGLIHFRPSGIRVKRATYVPALVAITQTSIIGPFKRRITPQEAALLQGLSIDFDFGFQSDSESYKQLGNGVSVGAATQVVHALVNRDSKILKKINGKILRSVRSREMHQKHRNNSEVKTERNLA